MRLKYTLEVQHHETLKAHVIYYSLNQFHSTVMGSPKQCPEHLKLTIWVLRTETRLEKYRRHSFNCVG